MKAISRRLLAGLSAFTIISLQPALAVRAQEPAAAAAAATANADQTDTTILSDDDLEILVARIALYPDDLVAAISAASLFPLQIVEAQRYLEAKKKDSKLKPKSDWDGSVISLLNYPDVVKMMSEDLDWTQSLADALTNQQKDVLIAIQQLRDEAVAKNIIKTDDKVTVVNENDNIIIRPTNPEKIYIPQYAPEMLYEPNYAPAPISYYPDSYDNYYYPGAGFFAAAVTGVAWAAAVNWNNWGVWGGNWRGDVDVDCNNCFNNRNFNGKVKWNDIDWKNVDRSKLSIGRDQLANIDRSAVRNGLQGDNRNQLSNRANELRANRGTGAGNVRGRADDIRRNTSQGLRANASNRPGAGDGINRANASRPEARGNRSGNRAAARPANRAGNVAAARGNKSRMAARPDNRGRTSALGNFQSGGRREAIASRRGGQSMGGGFRGGGRSMSRPAHRPQMSRGGGGRGGGGFRGGGGRGGGGRRR
ncbi:DUF3300 domain-containing protein [Neorhizobium sp. P12A]|uniref:DUF3300 domain-containing protein n=1 Tax=Neorhizobium sp. P12A TaxID=2268027 RepID=UPI0011EBE4DE|nr:DUF3300 domain-containing protein [Neorhizobium sp. P12A]KAA0697154.1 DUF3300 domain-containing protein [Neorhizobium sp. P12A]